MSELATAYIMAIFKLTTMVHVQQPELNMGMHEAVVHTTRESSIMAHISI